MADLRRYGILAEKGRMYENISYVLALIYGQINNEISHYLEKHSLTPAKFNILMAAAYQNEGKGLSQVQMAQHLISSAGNIAKLVDCLHKEKFLVRVQNQLNRRENIVKITPLGQKLIDKVWPGYEEIIRELTNLIPQNKQQEVIDVFADWFEKLQQRNAQ